jgi:hypothetical protein
MKALPFMLVTDSLPLLATPFVSRCEPAKRPPSFARDEA